LGAGPFPSQWSLLNLRVALFERRGIVPSIR
jgi:hypothetical protein